MVLVEIFRGEQVKFSSRVHPTEWQSRDDQKAIKIQLAGPHP